MGMSIWQNIVLIVIGAGLGFFLKILHGKITEKKAELSHLFSEPAEFSHIPPKVCFQDLRIWNSGDVPLSNIRINLSQKYFNLYDITYKVVTEEPYEEEKREEVTTLKFQRLLPKENLVIAFKSSGSISKSFLMNIKSDQVISQDYSLISRKGKGAAEWASGLVTVVATMIVILTIISHIFPGRKTDKIPDKPAVEFTKSVIGLGLSTNKTSYKPGEKMEVICQASNLGEDLLRDILFELEVPGFGLRYDDKYREVSFLKKHDPYNYKTVLKVPKEAPQGKYRIRLSARAKTLDAGVRNEVFAYFEIY
jgi:hypothetical protein